MVSRRRSGAPVCREISIQRKPQRGPVRAPARRRERPRRADLAQAFATALHVDEIERDRRAASARRDRERKFQQPRAAREAASSARARPRPGGSCRAFRAWIICGPLGDAPETGCPRCFGGLEQCKVVASMFSEPGTGRSPSGPPATSRAREVPPRAKPFIVYLVAEDWYFLSHRLPMARPRAAGYEVHVATHLNGAGREDRGGRVPSASARLAARQLQSARTCSVSCGRCGLCTGNCSPSRASRGIAALHCRFARGARDDVSAVECARRPWLCFTSATLKGEGCTPGFLGVAAVSL